jgi:microcystin-dependent protein
MALFSGGTEMINAGSLLVGGIATGTITTWTDSTLPTGFLECNGAAVSRSTYSALFNVIGTTYGAGNGSSTFNLPDLEDNVAIGKSSNKALASTGGANTVANSGNISGSTANATLSEAQLAEHNHPGNSPRKIGPSVPQNQSGTSGAANQRVSPNSSVPVSIGNAGSGDGHSHNMSANFSGTANSVIQPYIALIYIIKT